MFSPQFLSDWRTRLDQPITTGLLLSLSLHLALLALVQPAPGGAERGTLVINARLVSLPRAPAAAHPPAPLVPVPPVKAMAQPIVPPTKAPQPLLTSNASSPAPPLPVPPGPAAPAPSPVATAVPSGPPEAKPAAASAAAGGAMPQNGASAPLGIGIDTTWYVARQVDVHARALGTIVPDYPDEARRRNQEGTLKLMVKIDDLGRVRDVEVVEADLPGVFDDAALTAFRDAHFLPAMKDGHPVRYQAYIRVVFKLRD
jgi:protein TonB